MEGVGNGKEEKEKQVAEGAVKGDGDDAVCQISLLPQPRYVMVLCYAPERS